MDQKMIDDRRKFLKQIFAATVFTAACPHITLGRIMPELKENKNGITGIYKVRISDYPVLANLWGSVRVVVEGIPPEFKYPKLIISRIDEEYWNDSFSVVSEGCPHEGYPIELLNPEFVPDPLFQCVKGHGSLYLPTGTYFWGVSKKDLLKYDFTWDKGDNLFIEVPALTSSEAEEKYPELCFMSECFPNPAESRVKFLYGADTLSDIDISIYDFSGRNVHNLLNTRIPAGEFELSADISNLPSGNYFIKMLVRNSIRVVRKLIIAR
jgi:Rieske Fe-S protein